VYPVTLDDGNPSLQEMMIHPAAGRPACPEVQAWLRPALTLSYLHLT